MRRPLFPRAVLFLFVLVLSTSCQDDDPGPVTPPPAGDPPETVVIKGEEITTCPHCGRILYIEKESAAEEA